MSGDGGKAERDAVAEDGRPAPDEAERAHAGRVEHLELVEVGADGFGALHVEHHREHVVGVGGFHLGGGPADAHGAGGPALDPERDGKLRQRHREGALLAFPLDLGHVRRTVGRGLPEFGGIAVALRRHEGREDAAGHAALGRAAEVDVAVGSLAEEDGAGAVLARQAQQRVVVAIKDTLSHRHVLPVAPWPLVRPPGRQIPSAPQRVVPSAPERAFETAPQRAFSIAASASIACGSSSPAAYSAAKSPSALRQGAWSTATSLAPFSMVRIIAASCSAAAISLK